MKRRFMLAGFIIVAALVATQTATLGARSAAVGSNDELYKELELFEHALSIVRADYVEIPKPKELIYGALKGMLATLDPYSQFLDPDSYNELKVDTEGEFGGLGIEITIKDDLLTIISPLDGTPGAEAGLTSGDRIVKIDGKLTRNITLLEAVKQLRGKPGTSVKLTVLREGETSLKEFEIVRAIIKVESVREAKMLEDGIGYVRVSDFHENTAKDLDEAIGRLKEQGLEGLVLDLRNNPGGLLDVSVSVAELFLKKRQVVVTTKGRLRNQTREYRTRSDGIIQSHPMVVLVNEGSASASEIVAGAIQDHHRGIILGTKSHGKASVQTIFPLSDGSALRLTTAKYFTPAGRMIHGKGIVPDVVVPFEPPPKGEPKDKAAGIFNEIEANDNGKEVETKEYKRLDNQLARAVDLLKGIKVYRSRPQAIQ